MAKQSNRKLWASYLEVKGRAKGSSLGVAEAVIGRSFSGHILGIDPSLRGSGFSVIEFKKGEAKLLARATLKLRPKFSMVDCLGKIGQQVEDMLGQYAVDHVAIEQTIYVQNFQTAQIMGAARGAAIAPVAMRGLAVFEYAPLRIKQAIVGHGRASKAQVARMVGGLLNVDFEDAYDESDASAVALCHAFTWRGSESKEAIENE